MLKAQQKLIHDHAMKQRDIKLRKLTLFKKLDRMCDDTFEIVYDNDEDMRTTVMDNMRESSALLKQLEALCG